ncbi:MAG: hypothetical protein AAGF54_16355, partial [Pseudomonadota bacterium]
THWHKARRFAGAAAKGSKNTERSSGKQMLTAPHGAPSRSGGKTSRVSANSATLRGRARF